MKENTVAKAVILAGIIIAVSIVIASVILSHVPHFEKTGPLELLNTKSGSTYILKGEKQKGQPFYQVVPGPRSPGAYVEPQFKK